MPTVNNELVIEQSGPVVTITLNRPETLNALTLGMIRGISEGLPRWENDDRVTAIVFRGAGDRAFCAGGDIKATYYLRDQKEQIFGYFAEEYRMNRQLYHCKKPLIALMDGIVMGGGFGVAGPCRIRIATEKTKWAMPETGIGFFPDVGSAYFMNRAPGESGSYLAVTGQTISCEDALYAGFATHFCNSGELEKLMENFAKDRTLSSLPPARPETGGLLKSNQDAIDRCFSYPSVEQILGALQNEKSAWAEQTIDLMNTRSPLSMKVSLERCRRAKSKSFDEVANEDYVISRHFMAGSEFFEGVRAMLIDRDKKPHWNPKTLADVTESMVQSYFQSTG